ncbi:MAG: MFS transporter [Clostridiales Family XIII bacterium]|nr:MFS transporter [Clostridiales Family XIII bacterium]
MDINNSGVGKRSTLGYSDVDFKKFTKGSTVCLLMFSLLYCFLYTGRLNISQALPFMEEQMGWDMTRLGILSSILFWTYGCGHLINGRLGEIFGIKRFIVVGAVLSAIVNIVLGLQNSFAAIAILWGVNGYFQSMLWSPGMALLAKWWPGNRRGFATGFANAFSALGNAAAWGMVLIAFALLPNLGWRAAFIVPVISIFVMALIFALTVKQSPKDIGLEEFKEEDLRSEHEDELERIVAEKGKMYPYAYLFKQWRFDLWCIIIAFSNIARYGLLTFIPTYFVDELGMDVKSGLVGTLWLPLGMALGTFIVPWMSDKYSPNNRLPFVLICSLVSAATVFIFPNTVNMTLVVVLLFIAGFFIYSINGLTWAYATDIGGRVFGGTAAGILDWAAYMGAAVQAIIFGVILDTTNSWNAVFICIAASGLVIAILAIIAGRGKAADTIHSKIS